MLHILGFKDQFSMYIIRDEQLDSRFVLGFKDQFSMYIIRDEQLDSRFV
jgi:hypothetical protein